MAQAPLPSLRDMLRILFRQKYRAAFVFALATLLTGLAVVFLPRSYQSEAKLYIRIGREDVALDPVATPGESMQVSTERTGMIKSLMGLLTSRGVVEAVVEQIGAEHIMRGKLPDEEDGEASANTSSPLARLAAPIQIVRRWASEALDGRISAEEQAARNVEKWIEVDAEKKSHLITVVCTCGDARLAQRIVQEVVEEFRRRHIKAHQSQGSLAFFEEQKERLRLKLEEASRKLRDEKNELGVVSINVQREIIREEINNINNSIAAASAELAEARSKLAKIQQQYPESAAELQMPDGEPNEDLATGVSGNSLDQMRASLFALQLRERELAANYFENHPLREAIIEQLRDGKRIMAEQELLVATSNIGKWKAHLDAMDEKMRESQAKLFELNRSEIRVKEAEDVVERVAKAYTQYEENLEVARIDEALEKGRITNVRLVQDATLQHRPVKPKKFLLTAMGLMAAGVMSVGVAVACEYFDPTVKTNDEVEQRLEVPVLVSIPRMKNHRVRITTDVPSL